jgi:hypothetical protein
MTTEQKTAGYRTEYDPQEIVSYRYQDLPGAARALAEFFVKHDVLHALGMDDHIVTDKGLWMEGLFAEMAAQTILDLVDEGYEPAPRPIPDNPPF